MNGKREYNPNNTEVWTDLGTFRLMLSIAWANTAESGDLGKPSGACLSAWSEEQLPALGGCFSEMGRIKQLVMVSVCTLFSEMRVWWMVNQLCLFA